MRAQSVLFAEPRPAPAPEPVEATATAGAVREAALPADPDAAATATERQLRHELAHATDPTEAALELADLLCALERHREALAVVDTALGRADSPSLHVCRAGLLRDLGRRHAAVDELLGLVARHGAAGMHPALLFECAELQWLAGDGEAAQATLHGLEAAHGDDPWLHDNRLALDGLAEELVTKAAPPLVRVRDLLGSLRGGDAAADRIRLLGELCRIADAETGARRQHLRSRAVAIAAADPSPAVRARAVQLAEPAAEDVEAFCTAALDDDAGLVRRVAAERCAALAGRDAVPWLLDAIAREPDAGAFVAMHGALAELVADGPALFPTAANDAATREAVAAAWRQRCRP